MNNAVISGNYADLKTVKSRSVCQAIIEFPIEHMARFVEMFGGPVPGAEVPVAIARLKEGAAPSPEVPPPSAEPQGGDKVRRPFSELPYSQQAAIRCNDADFQSWLNAENADKAANRVRLICGVESRSDLNTNDIAARYWQDLDQQYRDWRFENSLPERRG